MIPSAMCFADISLILSKFEHMCEKIAPVRANVYRCIIKGAGLKNIKSNLEAFFEQMKSSYA